MSSAPPPRPNGPPPRLNDSARESKDKNGDASTAKQPDLLRTYAPMPARPPTSRKTSKSSMKASTNTNNPPLPAKLPPRRSQPEKLGPARPPVKPRTSEPSFGRSSNNDHYQTPVRPPPKRPEGPPPSSRKKAIPSMNEQYGPIRREVRDKEVADANNTVKNAKPIVAEQYGAIRREVRDKEPKAMAKPIVAEQYGAVRREVRQKEVVDVDKAPKPIVAEQYGAIRREVRQKEAIAPPTPVERKEKLPTAPAQAGGQYQPIRREVRAKEDAFEEDSATPKAAAVQSAGGQYQPIRRTERPKRPGPPPINRGVSYTVRNVAQQHERKKPPRPHGPPPRKLKAKDLLLQNGTTAKFSHAHLSDSGKVRLARSNSGHGISRTRSRSGSRSTRTEDAPSHYGSRALVGAKGRTGSKLRLTDYNELSLSQSGRRRLARRSKSISDIIQEGGHYGHVPNRSRSRNSRSSQRGSQVFADEEFAAMSETESRLRAPTQYAAMPKQVQ